MSRLLKKVMRDLFKDKRRAVLSLLAILIGTMSFGMVAFSYQIIPREIVGVYDAAIPASASVTVDRVDEKLIDLTNNFEGITIFEQRAFYNLRAQIGENQWKPLELFSAENFDALQINKITSEKGSFQPGMGEMLIERDAVGVAQAGLGDTLTIAFPNGSTRDLYIAGIVADITLHPASVHDSVYAFVSHDTLLDLGLRYNKIEFIITGEKYDKERILAVSNEYVKMLEQNGYTVSNLDISNTPGISMHLDEYKAGLSLLQIFSFVSFLFGCMIMSSLISSIISAQTRQIGILKSIGAGTGKITASYMLVFFGVIVLTTAVSAALSTLLAGEVSAALMSIGNMRPDDTAVSINLYVIYCGLALIVPMIIACFPIRRGVSISVKDAINDYGVRADGQGLKLPEPKFLSRPVLLSLRNALRRKRRFLLNTAILSVAGALFVSVVTSMISIQTTMTDNLNTWKFDYLFTSNTAYSDNELSEIIAEIPNVAGYENWGQSRGALINRGGEITNSYRILSPPDNSKMIEPEIVEGTWLTPDDANQIVVSHRFFVDEPDYAVGDTLIMQIGGRLCEFVIAGSMKDFGQVTVFMSKSGYEQYIPIENRLSNIRLSLNMTARENRRNAVYKAVEAALGEQGVLVLQTQSKTDLNAIVTEHYAVTMQTFFLITVMLVIVSGFGLAAAMNTQTSERTKEIGIMKAMGAVKKQITKIITAESIFIGLISWDVAVLLGIPAGLFSVYYFGNMILDTPLRFNIVSLLVSYAVWFLLTLAIGYFASRACAKRAAGMSVRDSLAFE
jgi:putative ABC transport system permease protein